MSRLTLDVVLVAVDEDRLDDAVEQITERVREQIGAGTPPQ